MKTEIKNRFTGSVIFEYTKENNSLKETIKEYIKQELASGKIRADLSYADLSSADLRYADLRSADLRSADLSSADLSSADLSSAKNKELSYLTMRAKWDFYFNDGKIGIGCKVKSIKEWDAFFKSSEKFETPRDSEDFKRIEASYKAYKAYFKHMKGNV